MSTSQPASFAAMFTATAAAAILTLLQGCALTPRGLDDERARLEAAGAKFEHVDAETLPVTAGGDDWRTLLRRALIANGDVRAAWYDWKAAVERVRGASAWPNSNISLGYSYLFSNESVKSFDRSTFTAGFDSMENLSFPGKTMASGRVALDDARAAGERFRREKFQLQRKVLDAWLDLAMAAENERIALAAATLADVGSDAAAASLRTGSDQSAVLSAGIAGARARDAAAKARAEVVRAKLALAALAAIESSDSIATPSRLPSPRTLPSSPLTIIRAAETGPDVRGLEHDRNARRNEQDLAELQWIPDINPTAAVTGSIEQSVGAILVLPTKIAEIQSGIAVAKAMRRGADARLVQARRDKGAEVRAALVAALDSERARRLLEQRVLPAATSAASVAESVYVAGTSGLSMLVEARTVLLETRKEIAAAAIDREKQLAAIEELIGADLETFTDSEAIRVAQAGRGISR
ncbi:MAG TPA: TolC family protein [Candidatus Limnocylindrales bacterium]|nr:TolC family protein [Candidatus Limnocylindrales bacterium]